MIFKISIVQQLSQSVKSKEKSAKFGELKVAKPEKSNFLVLKTNFHSFGKIAIRKVFRMRRVVSKLGRSKRIDFLRKPGSKKKIF